jgi:hypothetical protein
VVGTRQLDLNIRRKPYLLFVSFVSISTTDCELLSMLSEAKIVLARFRVFMSTSPDDVGKRRRLS